jgi:hypothetical protein
MTKKQLALKELAEAKNLEVIVTNGLTTVVFVKLANGTIGLDALGNKHTVWFTPKNFGSVVDITLTDAFAKVAA